VAEVMWLRVMILVRAVTPDQSCSTTSPGVATGRAIGRGMKVAARRSQ
jgi:hypothetical protein